MIEVDQPEQHLRDPQPSGVYIRTSPNQQTGRMVANGAEHKRPAEVKIEPSGDQFGLPSVQCREITGVDRLAAIGVTDRVIHNCLILCDFLHPEVGSEVRPVRNYVSDGKVLPNRKNHI